MLAVNAILGGCSDDLKPGTVGMLEMLERKAKKSDVLVGVKKSKLFKENVFPKIYKEDVQSFELSQSKKGAVHIKVANCPAPRLVPYHRLMRYIKSLDIGKVYTVGEKFCVGLEESEKVEGCYRDIEGLLVKLADFYLNHSQFEVTLDDTNTFYVALGGDGVPFWKTGYSVLLPRQLFKHWACHFE